MTTDPEVAKLAQEAAAEVYALGLHAEQSSMERAITRLFSPAMTALQEENERLKAERDESIEERKEFQCGESAALQRAEAAEAERDRLRERVEAVARELESLGKRSTDYDYAARQLRAAITPPASKPE